MNAVLDRCIARFEEREEAKQEEFRGLLTAFRNLYRISLADTPLLR